MLKYYKIIDFLEINTYEVGNMLLLKISKLYKISMKHIFSNSLMTVILEK
jgi:hypothetical protein